jgi:SAM-dependent methyltransferase
LKAVFKSERPEILDLGPLCGETVVYLADRGARVSVEELDVPPPGEPVGGDDAPPPVRPLRIDQPDETFDLVLAWEQCDFIPDDRLDEFGAELRRVLRPGGWLLLFSLNRKLGDEAPADRPSRYRIVADDRVSREPTSFAPQRRWLYPTRRIERALEPMSIQTLHLQRNQMREFLALKLAPGEADR